MRAILLAAGFGTRLRPITKNIPKCLVPIQGKPLLQRWLDQLSSAGIGPFLVNTHYLSEKVQMFIEKSSYKNDVTIKYEKTLNGTAGTLIHNKNFFDGEDGLLIHADNYCQENISEFLDAHKNRPSGCVVTMMIFTTDEPTTCGIVELDNRGVVIAFHEKVKNPPGNLANGAVYILSKEFFTMLDSEFINAKDFSLDVLPKLIHKVYTYQAKKVFLDIGTPKNYNKVCVNS